jgi:hypothetical protein
MNSQDLHNLQEAYNQVYGEEYRKLPHDKMIAKSNKFDKQYKTGPTNKSTTDALRRRADTHLTTIFHDPKQSQEKSAANKNRPESEKRSKTVSNEPKRFPNRLRRADGQGIKDSYEYDLYDIILSHLLDEGYADTQESAEAIMVNMSEDWRESIVEGNENNKMTRLDKKDLRNKKFIANSPYGEIDPSTTDERRVTAHDARRGVKLKKN